MLKVVLESMGISVMISWSRSDYSKGQCKIILFIIVLEQLSREIRSGCSELLYADDLALVNETLGSLKGRLETWKKALESKGLRVNVTKIKMMISSENVGKVTMEGNFPWLLVKGVGSNSILNQFCMCCLHERCSGIRGKLKEDSKI